MRSIEPSPRGLIEIFRPQKRGVTSFFTSKNSLLGVFFFQKSQRPLSIRERDWTRCSLRFPRRHSPLFQYKRHPSLKDERGIGQDAHFVSAQSLPSWRREELDSAVIPFRQLLSQYERGIGRLGHFVSLAGIPLSFNTRDTPLSIRERDWTRCSLRFTSCPSGYGRRP